MTRLLGLLAAGAVGLAVGSVGVLAIQSNQTEQPAALPLPTVTPTPEPLTKATVTTPTDALLLVWTPPPLPTGLLRELATLPSVEAVTVVRRDQVHLERVRDATGRVVAEAPGGMVIPLDAVAYDRESYAAVVAPPAHAAFDELGEGEAILGRTSAQLRQVGPGGALELAGGVELTVAAVVEDEAIGAAELAVTEATGAKIGVVTERYALARHRGERIGVKGDIGRIIEAEPDVLVRLRGTGETPFLRSGDAVLPQVLIKELFGEFAYSPSDGGFFFEQEGAWVDTHLVSVDLPVLGQVRCHRALVPALRGAMEQLQQENLAELVRSDGADACWGPRTLRPGNTELSRHAWGIAVDLNFETNRTGQASLQDERLVEIMQQWGFTWGGDWLTPEPAYFEYLRPPAA